MTSENDVHRAAQDIGGTAMTAIATKISAAVGSGELKLPPEALPALLELVERAGSTATRGAVSAYYRTFDAFKNSSVDPKDR